MEIRVKKGCNLPIQGYTEKRLSRLSQPKQAALNLDTFDATRFKVLVKVGDKVRIGEPLVMSKNIDGQMFVSPHSGVVKEIRRGLKRRLIAIVITLDETRSFFEYTPPRKGSREEILDFFMQSGLFAHIRKRPFDLIASPTDSPQAIFVRAAESLPFVPDAEAQVEGHELYFQEGLNTLKKLTDGPLHLVYKRESLAKAFTHASGVEKHTLVGPHPAATTSLHIHKIRPIKSIHDTIWTLSTIDVITIGKMMLDGKYFTERILALAGTGIQEEKRGWIESHMGYPLSDLLKERLINEPLCLISGDPLTGVAAELDDFLGFYHTSLTALPKNTKRQFLHFWRPGFKKFTATKAYITGHLKPPKEGFAFTTNQHGEERAFIDGSVYDRVMPMRIPTMHLIKAILAEDFELAEQLGLLEVASEDFALPAFICPSKIDMIQIVKEGLRLSAQDIS